MPSVVKKPLVLNAPAAKYHSPGNMHKKNSAPSVRCNDMQKETKKKLDQIRYRYFLCLVDQLITLKTGYGALHLRNLSQD